MITLAPWGYLPEEAWQGFLEELRRGGNVAQAARAAGIGSKTVYTRREGDPGFAALMRAAVAAAAVAGAPVPPGPADGGTEERVLAALRKGMLLREAASAAGISKATLVSWRRQFPGFDADVIRAAAEGGRRLSPCDRLECPGGKCGTPGGYRAGCRKQACTGAMTAAVLASRHKQGPGDAAAEGSD